MLIIQISSYKYLVIAPNVEQVFELHQDTPGIPNFHNIYNHKYDRAWFVTPPTATKFAGMAFMATERTSPEGFKAILASLEYLLWHDTSWAVVWETWGVARDHVTNCFGQFWFLTVLHSKPFHTWIKKFICQLSSCGILKKVFYELFS